MNRALSHARAALRVARMELAQAKHRVGQRAKELERIVYKTDQPAFLRKQAT